MHVSVQAGPETGRNLIYNRANKLEKKYGCPITTKTDFLTGSFRYN